MCNKLGPTYTQLNIQMILVKFVFQIMRMFLAQFVVNLNL